MRLGAGEGTDQHEEEDEGHDVGHVGHRLQDDANDPGQGLHRHAQVQQTKRPAAEPLRGAPRPFPNPSSSPSPHLPRKAELMPTCNHPLPSLLGSRQVPSSLRVPSLPEGVGDGDGIEFTNEKPQEQDKDDKEVEDVPAVLGGWASPSRVCQAQPVGSSWVCPPHTLRMGGSTVLSEPGQSRAIHCGPAVAPQTCHKTPTRSLSHTRVHSAVSEHTVEPLTHASS